MKILIVSWFFPPTNTIGAVRLGSLAHFLHQRGHDVRVITAENPDWKKDLALRLPEKNVVYAPWKDVAQIPLAPIRALKRLIRWTKVATPAAAAKVSQPTLASDATVVPNASPLTRTKQALWNAYYALIYWPDRRIGWVPYALKAGHNLIEGWRPDLVFGSGPPFSTFLVAHRLGRRHDIPVVVEFRDRWSDDPYDPLPAWRVATDRFAERHILHAAAGIVTVSEPWAEVYRETFCRPTVVVYNGFDADLLPSDEPVGAVDRPDLRIVYAGGIYAGYRDPSPLFAAIAGDPSLRTRVTVEFWGTDPKDIEPMIARYNIGDAARILPRVSHAESLRQQRQADVLLMIQWNDPKEAGNLPGKLFEYLGARRPILGIGYEKGVAAQIIRSRGAGFFSSDVEAIASQLRHWLTTKQAQGFLSPPSEEAMAGFSRTEQFSLLEGFLESLVRQQPGSTS
jgi:glycosyltransferase involved in cell wall biosynthesis